MKKNRVSAQLQSDERVIPINAVSGHLNSTTRSISLSNIDDLLPAVRCGISCDEDLAYITASYYALPLEGRLALLSSLADEPGPELLDFLAIAALDEKVAPCLEIASVLSDIVSEKAARVLRILLSHADKSVRQAAREVLFALRGKGLALALNNEEPRPESDLPWWTAKCPIHKVVLWKVVL